MTLKQRIFSGIQPSGNLHIGNYLGAIANWIKLQDEFDSIFCVVDMHAITVAQNPEMLRKKTIEIAKIYLAAGIDPKKSSIFIQSQVSEHAELCWILNTITKIPELEKMTQFKDKAQKNDKESAGVGLFDYPVLMAADILLYGTEVVPVGEDQKQHVELARDLAKRFNQKFGETFIVPKVFIKEEGMRIMGLDDPSKKMSKSAASEYNYISLLDDEETVKRKIKKAVTDSGSEIVYSNDKPALKNLINIFSSFSGKTPKEIEKMYVGKGYGDFKMQLAEVVIGFLTPFQEKFNSLSDEEVLKILEEGSRKVEKLAKLKMKEIKEKIGFIV
ncbi:MAG: Tryptophan-tRNA ligase [Candidatus Moranbacteria bacterium GW2011_GWE1_36_7]|nr:MAG: Tryptophan-tRNA ligase [Candidatus Moranbacteria bacterium GW2011_GWD2_36_12]KKQ06024.1 MAG: Tryptophan-tRNA ligase [Candidatus Moranbacteria bacterium GW2011_GWE2_36_40]KKQ12039.1 MAG: Tryptophan-tRNA ligase [Candidatus Moranbacteria bacterium GW2011_GWE1_36_7]